MLATFLLAALYLLDLNFVINCPPSSANPTLHSQPRIEQTVNITILPIPRASFLLCSVLELLNPPAKEEEAVRPPDTACKSTELQVSCHSWQEDIMKTVHTYIDCK